MIVGIIVVISFLLDGILSNFLSYMVGDLSFFTPLFTVMSLFLIYPFFKKREKKKYFLFIMGIGIVYDLFYTNLLFFHAFIFLALGGCIMLLYRYLDINYFMILWEGLLIVCLYHALTAFLFWVFQVVPITKEDFLYLLEHTILINLIYLEVVFFILRLLPKKYWGLSIN